MSTNKVATKADLQEFYNRILPYLGGMPEILANKFSKGDLYSTDEKMIGQWIDGKPLYQKTIVKNNFTIGNDTSFTHGITNVDKIFIKDGFIDDNGSFVMMPLLWSTSYDGVLIDATKIVFKGTGTWGAQSTRTIYFVIQYTKTTDSAISIGSDTDYSTDEKIVGTWIGGKPIFQKTLNNVTVPKNSTSALIENVDLLVDCKLSYVRGGVRTTNQAFYNSASDMVLVIPAVNESTHSFYIYWNSPYTLSDFNITVQYTKTT